jgi:uncharacterized protein YxjI
MGLIDHDRFFVRQKAKLIEVTAEFAILDESGTQIGKVTEVGQSKAKKVLRFVSSVDQFLSKKFSVVDADGTTVLALQRGAKFIKSKIEVLDGQGTPVGMIAQQNAIGKIRFGFTGANGEDLGGIFAENWRAWNFRMEDPSGKEVGRVTKEWAGAMKEMFTTADNYLVELSPDLTGTARMLAFAAAVTVDTALKQDE